LEISSHILSKEKRMKKSAVFVLIGSLAAGIGVFLLGRRPKEITVPQTTRVKVPSRIRKSDRKGHMSLNGAVHRYGQEMAE
jgi:hypothetical protein